MVFTYDTISSHYVEMKKNELSRLNSSILYIVEEEYLSTNSQNFDHIIKVLGDDLGLRLTIIDIRGIVIADSQNDPSKMENHSSRPEFIKSLNGSVGSNIRISVTNKQEMLYVASPVYDHVGKVNLVLRSSVFISDLDLLFSDLVFELFFILIIILIVSGIVLYIFLFSAH